jgi:hypothetical protein
MSGESLSRPTGAGDYRQADALAEEAKALADRLNKLNPPPAPPPLPTVEELRKRRAQRDEAGEPQ